MNYTVRNPVLRLGLKALCWVAKRIEKPEEGRKRLDPRREGIRESITFEFSGKVKRTFDVTFNRDGEGVVREVFCAGAHTQSDLQGLVEDSCIALSIALQYGARIADIAKSFGELRDEGATNGPPASPLGTIARRGAEIEAEFAEGATA
jgi:hypothetical protein